MHDQRQCCQDGEGSNLSPIQHSYFRSVQTLTEIVILPCLIEESTNILYDISALNILEN